LDVGSFSKAIFERRADRSEMYEFVLYSLKKYEYESSLEAIDAVPGLPVCLE
jgi:hypothetical protein